MREWKGDLWSLVGNVTHLCITTNGDVNKGGRAVMGKGCAREAANLFAQYDVAKILGRQLQRHNNVPLWLGIMQRTSTGIAFIPNNLDGPQAYGEGTFLFTFPVKHHWGEPADPGLIDLSARRLAQMFQGQQVNIAIPRPGCGNGQLKWEEQVKPILTPVFDDRFLIVNN